MCKCACSDESHLRRIRSASDLVYRLGSARRRPASLLCPVGSAGKRSRQHWPLCHRHTLGRPEAHLGSTVDTQMCPWVHTVAAKVAEEREAVARVVVERAAAVKVAVAKVAAVKVAVAMAVEL